MLSWRAPSQAGRGVRPFWAVFAHVPSCPAQEKLQRLPAPDPVPQGPTWLLEGFPSPPRWAQVRAAQVGGALSGSLITLSTPCRVERRRAVWPTLLVSPFSSAFCHMESWPVWQGQMGWPQSWAQQDQPGPRGSRGAKAEGVPSKAGAPAGNIAYEGQQASQGPIHVALETDLPLCTGPGLGLPLGVWEEDGTGMGGCPWHLTGALPWATRPNP